MPRRPLVLVVEDDQVFRNTLIELFKRWRYATVTARDGEEAVRIIDEKSIDLLICDIVLPRQDGITTIAEARRLDPSIAIIAMTGMGRPMRNDLGRLAEQAGANAVVFKPFSSETLLDRVSRLMSEPRMTI